MTATDSGATGNAGERELGAGMRGAVAALVALAAWLTAFDGAARAADDDEEALIRRGVELRKRGDDRAALQELQRAYRLARSPRAAAQLGFAEQALAMWPQAETHVSESLRAKDDPWINKNRAVIEESLRTIRAHVGRVEIAGGRPGAAVAVNGQRVGTMPLAEPVAVSAGPVDIEVRAAGHLPAVKTVNVAAGEYARVSFALVAEPPTGGDAAAGRARRAAGGARWFLRAPAAAADAGAGADPTPGRGRRVGGDRHRRGRRRGDRRRGRVQRSSGRTSSTRSARTPPRTAPTTRATATGRRTRPPRRRCTSWAAPRSWRGACST